MTDPMEVLLEPIAPVAPSPAFARDLRRRIETALGRTTPATTPAAGHLPAGMTALTPYLCVRGAARAIEWYKDVFAAVEHSAPIVGDDGRIGHAELRIEGALFFVADEWPEYGNLGPESFGGTGVGLNVYVPDADAVVAHAAEEGAVVVRPVEHMPYGARSGTIVDPFGHQWMVSTHVESMTQEEFERRFAEEGWSIESIESSATTTEGTRSEVGYFTLNTPDAGRARKFYGAVLGWTFAPGSVDQGWQITNVTPMGGVWGGQDRSEVTILFNVDDIDAAVAKVRELGGEADDPENRPYGRYAACRDNQGLRFDLNQVMPDR